VFFENVGRDSVFIGMPVMLFKKTINLAACVNSSTQALSQQSLHRVGILVSPQQRGWQVV